jgi:two-component system sensor histidine kinase BaeS
MYCGVKGEDILLSIEDNGEGVPDGEIHRIFERFYRVEKSRSRASGGSGLSLATCKSIIEAHGGKSRLIAINLEG